ncbi:ankyrin repeat protein [Caulobacter ginsengisoli]|uniref:Ankyrin repeat protein n=1 Tax=Caulobacter ginsengisoli TaxID=400775 RepID=A0ABU0IMY1_9CAUL|nr:DUF6438 domain-containing protein [Caulobacter ginsengisoli]MDQ0462374.1 ankyrin repeat protein [Caulobacter ginsengisoli]
MHRLLVGLFASQIVWLATVAAAACPTLASFDTGAATGQFGSVVLGPSRAPAPARPSAPMPEGRLEETVVSLERSACYGRCPTYRVELRGDGTARFEGERDVLLIGERVMPLDPSAFACLLDHLREADFWSLPDEYVANVTDGPTYMLTVSIGGRAKTVKDYRGRIVGMPRAVSQIEAEIDALGAAPWINGNDRTLPLLEAAGFDFRSPAGGKLLAGAVLRHNDALALALLARGAPAWGDAPLVAADSGNAVLLKALIEAGAVGPGAPADMKERILLAAADSGDLEVLKLALSVGPDVNARSARGTALVEVVDPYWSRSSGAGTRGQDQATAVKLLLDAGADVNAHDEDGGTALHRADYPEVVRLLIAAGANVNARDNEGSAPLHKTWNAEIARLLIEAGAEVDARDNLDRTPLLVIDDDGVALQLLQAGADPRAADKFGETVLKRARYHRWKQALALLKAKGIR